MAGETQVSWQFDKARVADPSGDRPVMFTFVLDSGPSKTTVQFVLPGVSADKVAGDLLNALSGGIEVAREMPKGVSG